MAVGGLNLPRHIDTRSASPVLKAYWTADTLTVSYYKSVPTTIKLPDFQEVNWYRCCLRYGVASTSDDDTHAKCTH